MSHFAVHECPADIVIEGSGVPGIHNPEFIADVILQVQGPLGFSAPQSSSFML